MRPGPLRIGSLELPPYPLVLYVAIVAGIVAQNEAVRQAGIDAASTFVVAVVSVAVALVAAKLWYLAEHAPPWRGWRDGGMCLTGGLVGGIAAAVALAGGLGLPLASLLDASAAGLCIALAIARLGCWLNGCCGGRPTSAWWGVWSRDPFGGWARRVPTQALEGAWAATLAVALLVGPGPRGEGATFVAALGAYVAGRQLLLPLRGSRRLRLGRDRALGVAALSVALLAAFA